jgi:hypothetical protein
MGGSSPKPAKPAKPDSSQQWATLLAMTQLQGAQLLNQAKLRQLAASMPPPQYTPDIPGMQQLAREQAEINAVNSIELEKRLSPDAAALRKALPASLSESMSTEQLQNAMKQWSKTIGLSNALQSGQAPADSTFAQSAYFDMATPQYAALKRQAQQDVQSYLAGSPLPQAGLSPGALVQAREGAKAQNIQNQFAFQQGVLGGAEAGGQSASNWINQTMGNISNQQASDAANWQNYQNALIASQNQPGWGNALGSGIGSLLGAIGGSFWGPLGSQSGMAAGGALGGGIGSMFR